VVLCERLPNATKIPLITLYQSDEKGSPDIFLAAKTGYFSDSHLPESESEFVNLLKVDGNEK
jgi:hypothetical protein